MNPLLSIDYLDEILNVSVSTRMRWATALKTAGEPYLAEEVFPDTPAFETERENQEQAA